MTIATNMAGRGTDIQLGGNYEARITRELEGVPEGPERAAAIAQIKAEVLAEREAVRQVGGLFVLGTERHESAASTTSCAGVQAVRATPDSAASTSASTTICSASSASRTCSRG